MMWPSVSLDDVCTVAGGTTPSTTNKDYWDGDIIWLSPVDLPEVGTISMVGDSKRKITARAIKECGLQLLPKGSLVFSSRASIGKIGIVSKELTTNQGFTNFIPSKKLDVRYLAYALKKSIPTIESLGNTTTFKEVSRTALKKFRIPLPPLHIQKHIADTLDKADALRKKDQLLLQKYDELAQSIFYDMFGDPVKNEKGWEMLCLEEMADKKKGSIRTGPFGSQLLLEELTESGIPVYGIDNVMADKFVWSKPKFISESKFKELVGFKIAANDVLVTRTGTVGRACVAPNGIPNSIIGPNLLRVSLNTSVLLPELFSYLLNNFDSIKDKIKSLSPGATVAVFNSGNLKKLELCKLPINDQKKFVKILRSIKKQKDIITNSPTYSLFQGFSEKNFSN